MATDTPGSEDYVFVWQEWDLLRQVPEAEAPRLEKKLAAATTSCFAVELQEARIERRFSIEALAEKADIPLRTMTLYENGSEFPTAAHKARLTTLLGLK